MKLPDRLSNLWQRFSSDSTSWGSLIVLAIGVTVAVLMMAIFARS